MKMTESYKVDIKDHSGLFSRWRPNAFFDSIEKLNEYITRSTDTNRLVLQGKKVKDNATILKFLYTPSVAEAEERGINYPGIFISYRIVPVLKLENIKNEGGAGTGY
jgi:hypothetical protein